MAKPSTPPQRPAAQTPEPVAGGLALHKTPPAAPTKEPEPLCVTLTCRTCVWLSSGGRCHRYPPTVICPQKDASDFPLVRPGFWCGEHRAK